MNSRLANGPRAALRRCQLVLAACWIAVCAAVVGNEAASKQDVLAPGIAYTNERIAEVPWSLHIVRVERARSLWELLSVHAGDNTMGLAPLSAQVRKAARLSGYPVAAINGDFFNRETPAGVPRGLQIADGEVLSAPAGRVAFWIDRNGQPHAARVVSRFHITWPDGSTIPCGLNEDPRSSTAVLYTPAMARSIQATGGQELTLENAGKGPWLPLRMEETYKARVSEVRTGTGARLKPGIVVLSLSPSLIQGRPPIRAGTLLAFSTFSSPGLRGVKTALGGGPVLIRNGSPAGPEPAGQKSYTLPSFLDRNPRSAIGWNKRFLFLVEVDGRQKHLSAGMTLEELTSYLLRLGCVEAMNLDGGGSSTLWFQDRVMNSPSDGKERDIANSLVVIRKRSAAAGGRGSQSDAPAADRQ